MEARYNELVWAIADRPEAEIDFLFSAITEGINAHLGPKPFSERTRRIAPALRSIKDHMEAGFQDLMKTGV